MAHDRSVAPSIGSEPAILLRRTASQGLPSVADRSKRQHLTMSRVDGLKGGMGIHQTSFSGRRRLGTATESRPPPSAAATIPSADGPIEVQINGHLLGRQPTCGRASHQVELEPGTGPVVRVAAARVSTAAQKSWCDRVDTASTIVPRCDANHYQQGSR
jgi:hypothetical protein